MVALKPADVPIAVGALDVHPGAYRATLEGRPLELTPSQFEVLAYLVINRDRVVTRDELARAGHLEHVRSVDVALSSLRRALGCDFLRNVRNRGWILEPTAFSTVD